MNHDGVEVEIKTELDDATYAAIRRSFSRIGMTTRIQSNRFFDTDSSTLLARRWVMRLRDEADRSFLTLKGKAVVNGSVHIRPEFEDEISGRMAEVLRNGFAPADFNYSSCMKVRELFGDVRLEPFMSFVNERSEIPWKSYMIELDRTTVRGRVFYELEVETGPANAEALEREIRSLFSDHGWRFMPSLSSKFARALRIYGIEFSD